VSVELRTGKFQTAFHRSPSGAWLREGGSETVPAELGGRLDDALQFMHVSEPARTLGADELRGVSFSGFGLDPPVMRVTLADAGGTVKSVNFGALNAASTSQYVRLTGQAALHLLPRHAGSEWEVALDLAKRLPRAGEGGEDLRPAKRWLLPASMDRIWAVEILLDGKLHRLERDDAGGWFLHNGQHSHAKGAPAHIADPAQAQTIASVLSGLDEIQIETSRPEAAEPDSLAKSGLDRPKTIVLFYARDNSQPLIRVEFGNLAKDGFAQYARVNRSGGIVEIAAYEAGHLVELLKNLGALS
jgi:hypothetical protein